MPAHRVYFADLLFFIQRNGRLPMRTMIFLLLVTFLPSNSVFPCDVPPQSSADDKVTTDSEPLVWPPKPEKTLLHGMWLAPAGDALQTLLWLRDDGSWTTASVLGKSESVDSLETVVTAQDPWHIDRLDDKGASYVLVLGQPRPTRCGPGSMNAPTYAINRVTATRLVLQQFGQTSDQLVYHRADPALAAKIKRRIDDADEEAKSKVPRSAESMADGIYAVHYEGQGKTVRRTDGGEIILAERLTDRFGEASMFSVTYDNTRFALNLKGAGPIPAKRTAPYFAVILDGYVLAVAGHSDPHPDATMDLGVQVFGVEAAKAVEQRLKIAARRRSHPGHRC